MTSSNVSGMPAVKTATARGVGLIIAAPSCG